MLAFELLKVLEDGVQVGHEHGGRATGREGIVGAFMRGCIREAGAETNLATSGWWHVDRSMEGLLLAMESSAIAGCSSSAPSFVSMMSNAAS